MPILKALLVLVLTVIGALRTQYPPFGLMIMFFGRTNQMPFYRKMLEPQLLAFSTSSSKATLSTAMRVVNEQKCRNPARHSCCPLGASIRWMQRRSFRHYRAVFLAPVDAHKYFI